MTDAANKIRQAVAEVGRLRIEGASHAGLGASVLGVKRFQARRFTGTYADLLTSGGYAQAARFFLDELYSDRDFAERDQSLAEH